MDNTSERAGAFAVDDPKFGDIFVQTRFDVIGN